MGSSDESYSPQQLSLGVYLNDDATFNNFFVNGDSHNRQAVDTLQALAAGNGEPYVYLWGQPGVGLTHLLHAICHSAQQNDLSIQYLPIRELLGFDPTSLLDGLEGVDVVCLDGLHHIAGNVAWEQALFHLFNRLRDMGKTLVIASEYPPHDERVSLPDLRSRLCYGLSYQVAALDDSGKQQALIQRAHARGLQMTDEVARYILSRAPRDMNELFRYLAKLDNASLAEQRKLSIPFVKRVLNL